MVMEEMSLVQRIKDYFGMESRDLMNDYKKLTDTDKAWFVDEFNRMGLPTALKKAIA
jgi:hypothetical protein